MLKPFRGYNISDRFVVTRNDGPPLYAAHSEADALMWIQRQSRLDDQPGYGPDGDDYEKEVQL